MSTVLKKLNDEKLMVRLNDRGSLSVDGLKESPKADKLRQYIRDNKDQIILELKAVDGICSSAHDLLYLARKKEIRLHVNGKGGLWWSAPKYYDDPGSMSWIAQLWEEAFPDMFLLLDAGRLEQITKR